MAPHVAYVQIFTSASCPKRHQLISFLQCKGPSFIPIQNKRQITAVCIYCSFTGETVALNPRNLPPEFEPSSSIATSLQSISSRKLLLTVHVHSCRSKKTTIQPWGTVVLTTRHHLSAKVTTNFSDKRRQFGRYSLLEELKPRSFLSPSLSPSNHPLYKLMMTCVTFEGPIKANVDLQVSAI
jgi:hypothetical protein